MKKRCEKENHINSIFFLIDAQIDELIIFFVDNIIKTKN